MVSNHTIVFSKYRLSGTSLVAQRLRLRAPNAGGPGSMPGQGTRSHMHAATKSLHAATKTQHNQINKYLKKEIIMNKIKKIYI